MNKKIIYLKEVNSYNDILKKEYNKMPVFLKKVIFIYKNMFNIITKKKYEETEIWILPIKEKYHKNKIESIVKRQLNSENNIYVISEKLQKLYNIMEKERKEYITEEKIKKLLLINMLQYISNLQNKKINNLEVTILVNNNSEFNIYILSEIAKQVKNLKIVSLNIYKFKKLEEKLYNEHGIPLQFSNSYKKSLEKSKIIVNFDFSETEINEYKIFDKAIIINCIKDNIKIKTMLFNGIVVNSCNIDYDKEIICKFKKVGIYENYKKLLIYASIIENEKNILKIYDNIKQDNVTITSLIGNSRKY